LSFVAGNTFDDDDEEGEKQQFVYKSSAELMLDELEVSMHFYSYLFFKRKWGVKQMLCFPSTSGNGIFLQKKPKTTQNKT
jgi:hypothetical protein